ncbi:MAG: hypothetical protein J5I53_10700, partial [Bradyrhizobiaceae bacterium]|nr:hypothetical protein [Bradyrhizobiaceae bacterium]
MAKSRTHYIRVTQLACAVMAAIVMIAGNISAQPLTYVPGWTGAGALKTSSYTYNYNYPEDYLYMYALYGWYDYYNPGYNEFVVLASDMKAAGLCAGPVNAMSLRFLRNPINWNANFRIFMRNIGSEYWIPYTGNAGGYYYYYTWCLQKPGSKIEAHPNAVEVYSNPSWTLGVIPDGDTTWVDWEFNNGTFVWDGTSNIAIGMYRCNNASMTINYQYADFMCVHVRPPNPPNYSSYWPWVVLFNYFGNANSCDNLNYSLTWPYLYYYNYQTYVSEYKAMRPEVRLAIGAGISQSYPDDVDPRRILKSGDNYNGGDLAHPKPSLTYYEQAGKTYKITYKITGPSPSNSAVYTAMQGASTTIQFTGSSNGWKTYTMNQATGTYAGTGGALNLTSATGGSYKVVATLETDCGTQQWTKAFVVAFPNDVAMAEIRSPKESPKKNPLNVTLPLSCQIQNVGLNNVTDVDVEVTLRTYPGGQQVYNGTQNWKGSIGTGERAVVDFTSAAYIPTVVGKYTADFCVTLKNAIDQQAFNDCLPQAGDTHIYEVNYNQEGGVYQINKPSTTEKYFANRPFRPEGTIQNNGILDGSNWPVRMEIFKMPGMQKVYTETVTLQSIDAAAPNNFAVVQFPLFTPDAAGDYRACMKLMTNDPDGSNDELCRDFTVNGNMSGTYTIGLKNIGKANNYPNFELAINDLYLKGVSGPVKFELTDNTYTIQGTSQSNGVALDLSGYVPGMSAQNTVSFVPSLEQSLTRGSITITLNSLNGVGVLFGQNLTPTNPQSLARQFPTVRSYSNSAGHYIFDGGSQRSIRVNLSATTPFRAPFYLGDGSQHIVLKNMLIGNASNSTPSYANSLPRVFFTNGQFTYEQDVRSIGGQTYTYSGGIVDRNKMPVGTTGNNSERLDTIAGKNNQFIGNEISGFGYGVVSLGIGTLLKGGVNEFRSYYSTGTQISGNVIYGCGRAGIVAGYQDGLQVMGNRIYSIGQISSGVEKNGGVTQAVSYADDACGILLGGNNQYNVLNTTVSGNEISGIRGQLGSRGIVVDQVRNSFQSVSAAGGMYYAPNGPEHTLVASNTVWGLSRNATTTHMGGIHVLTGRSANDQLVPAASDYFTRQDTIANNTVVMTNDNVSGTGAVFAIGTQHGNGTAIFNNAIAMQGTSTASSTLHAGLFYEGTLFRGSKNSTWYLDKNAPAAMVSNNNAFYTPNSSIAQFVEVSASSEIVSSGSPSEFKTMGQWRSWTSQDINSVEGNFTTQLEYRGVAPSQKLRINITPKAPIGSILNDRGIRIASITKDIDGEQRGATGLGYDIGADEFGGRLYVSDLEAVDILKPTAYRSTSGATSDAEYIMTTTPVDVTARIRNSGSLPRTDADIRVRIWVETAASNNGNYANPVWSANTVVDQTYAIDLNSGASTDIVFGIQGFAPQTYQQLVGYTVPSRFSAMALNVTPRYRIEVSTPNDENNGNNSVSKVTRFYIKRSGTSIMVSGRY